MAVLSALCLLAACGGGGDAGPAPVAPPAGPPPAVTGTHDVARAGPGTGPAPQPAAGEALADEVVVMLLPGAALEAVAASIGAAVADRFGQRPIWRLRLPSGLAVDDAVARLTADARVRFAEANRAGEVPLARDIYVWAVGQDGGAYANPSEAPALGLGAAQALSRGDGVRVAVLDTGIDLSHPALAGRLARRADGRLLGIDLVDGDHDPSVTGTPADAGHGHGTHVAGVVARVAPAARLMPVRVLDTQGRGNAWVLAEALLWAVDPDGNPATDDGAHIVNFSLATPAPTRLLRAALALVSCDNDDASDDINFGDPGFEADQQRCNGGRGVVVMAAAGNDGSDTLRQYPAAEVSEGKLAITAGTGNGRLATFANRGPWVDLVAPGERIVSAYPGGGYAAWSGTSMATPVASGVAALVLARHPDWKPVDVTQRLLDRSVATCGHPTLRGLHAHGAVADFVPPDPAC